MFRSTRTVVILTTLFAATVALADEKADDLRGTFTAKAGDLNLSMTLDKGNVVVTFNGQLAVKGTYRISMNEIEFTDVEGSHACKGDVKTGKYRWKLSGEKLSFTKVDDKCEGRQAGLTSTEWTKAGGAEQADEGDSACEEKKEGDKPNSADVMKLQGEWVASEGFEADMTMVIKGNKFALKDGERAVEGTFTIDAAKSPKTMDLTVTGGSADREVEQFKGKTSQAIYTVDDKQFKWCASEPGKDARPAEFARGDALYIVFERKSADE